MGKFSVTGPDQAEQVLTGLFLPQASRKKFRSTAISVFPCGHIHRDGCAGEVFRRRNDLDPSGKCLWVGHFDNGTDRSAVARRRARPALSPRLHGLHVRADQLSCLGIGSADLQHIDLTSGGLHHVIRLCCAQGFFFPTTPAPKVKIMATKPTRMYGKAGANGAQGGAPADNATPAAGQADPDNDGAAAEGQEMASGAPDGDEGAGAAPVDETASRQAQERQKTHHRHVKEHLDAHRRHEHEHMTHKGQEGPA